MDGGTRWARKKGTNEYECERVVVNDGADCACACSEQIDRVIARSFVDILDGGTEYATFYSG